MVLHPLLQRIFVLYRQREPCLTDELKCAECQHKNSVVTKQPIVLILYLFPQMDLLNLSAGFVRETNNFLHKDKQDGIDRDSAVGSLIKKIRDTQLLVDDAGDRVGAIMKRLQSSSIIPDKIFYIMKSGVPVCVVGEEVSKPSIEEVTAEKLECSHSVSFQQFKPFTTITCIETSSQLVRIDRTIRQAALEVFDHTYRSYAGFVCFISLGDTEGNMYIIDAIKFRDVIPSLSFLKCGVPKIIHCRGCVKRLSMDFKQLGCFRNYNMSSRNIFVDWRIRPVPALLLEILQEGVLEIAELTNNHREPDASYVDEDSEQAETENMISKYKISGGSDILRNLLKLRRFLAKSNDESIYYVMTDDQLIDLFNVRPKTQKELSNSFSRLSPLVRQHISDFIFALSDVKRESSLQGFMRPGIHNAPSTRTDAIWASSENSEPSANSGDYDKE